MKGSWRGSIGLALWLCACTNEPASETAAAELAPAEPAAVEPPAPQPAAVEPTPVKPASTKPLVQHPAKVEGFIMATLPPHWRLSFAPAGATPLIEGVAVALQRDGLHLGNEHLVGQLPIEGRLDRSAIADHLVVPLAERAEILAPGLIERAEARDQVWDGHVNLYLDPDALVGDLVDVVYTLGRHGFGHYQIASSPTRADAIGTQWVEYGLEFEPPKYVQGGTMLAEPVQVVVMLTEVGVEFGLQIDGGEITWYGIWTWDREPMQELERLAADFAHGPAMAEAKGERTIVFIAEPRLRVGLLIEAMNAASGSACTFVDAWKFEGGDPKRCHFVDRVLQAAP
jgi:hypothetical protein